MLRILTFLSFVLFTAICCSDSQPAQLAVTNSRERRPEVLRNIPAAKLNIKNTKGVVIINKFEKGDFVRIYNDDGTLWYEFSYFYDDSDGKFDYPNDEFRPFAFDVDHFLLALKCTRHDDNSLEVVVNEETGLRKYVKANDPVLKLKAWDKFVLSVFAVTFDQTTNPLLEGPSDQMKKVVAPESVTFRPVETQGNWLKVTWHLGQEHTTETKSTESGWIRWRNDETLLIELSYFA